MKNKFLALLLTSMVVSVSAHYHSSHLAVSFDQDVYQCYGDQNHYCSDRFLPSERCLRRQLYWLYRYNPHCLELVNFPIDYFITVLAEHIKTLEIKIVEKESGLYSNAMLRGTALSSFATLWGYCAYDSYIKRASSADPQGAVISTVILGAATTLLAAIAGSQFHKVYRHDERLVGRLERDKQILAALEKIKASRDGSVGTVAASSLNMVNSVIGVLNSLVQPLSMVAVSRD